MKKVFNLIKDNPGLSMWIGIQRFLNWKKIQKSLCFLLKEKWNCLIDQLIILFFWKNHFIKRHKNGTQKSCGVLIFRITKRYIKCLINLKWFELSRVIRSDYTMYLKKKHARMSWMCSGSYYSGKNVYNKAYNAKNVIFKTNI